MKNIFIVGVPRSGKSTLAKMLGRELNNYNIISFEAIRNGFIKSQPDLEMNNRNSDARKEILPSFILEFINWNKRILDVGNIIEGDFIKLPDLNNAKSDEDIIICLGFKKRNIDLIYDNQRKFNKIDDYTYNWDREKFKKHFYDLEMNDEFNYNYCLENDINYYDTFEEREKIMKEIVDMIKNTM